VERLSSSSTFSSSSSSSSEIIIKIKINQRVYLPLSTILLSFERCPMGGIDPASVLLESKDSNFVYHSNKENSYSAGGESGFSSSSRIIFIA